MSTFYHFDKVLHTCYADKICKKLRVKCISVFTCHALCPKINIPFLKILSHIFNESFPYGFGNLPPNHRESNFTMRDVMQQLQCNLCIQWARKKEDLVSIDLFEIVRFGPFSEECCPLKFLGNILLEKQLLDFVKKHWDYLRERRQLVVCPSFSRGLEKQDSTKNERYTWFISHFWSERNASENSQICSCIYSPQRIYFTLFENYSKCCIWIF